jgi:hypothetical protein
LGRSTARKRLSESYLGGHTLVRRGSDWFSISDGKKKSRAKRDQARNERLAAEAKNRLKAHPVAKGFIPGEREADVDRIEAIKARGGRGGAVQTRETGSDRIKKAAGIRAQRRLSRAKAAARRGEAQKKEEQERWAALKRLRQKSRAVPIVKRISSREIQSKPKTPGATESDVRRWHGSVFAPYFVPGCVARSSDLI